MFVAHVLQKWEVNSFARLALLHRLSQCVLWLISGSGVTLMAAD